MERAIFGFESCFLRMWDWRFANFSRLWTPSFHKLISVSVLPLVRRRRKRPSQWSAVSICFSKVFSLKSSSWSLFEIFCDPDVNRVRILLLEVIGLLLVNVICQFFSLKFFRHVSISIVILRHVSFYSYGVERKSYTTKVESNFEKWKCAVFLSFPNRLTIRKPTTLEIEKEPFPEDA